MGRVVRPTRARRYCTAPLAAPTPDDADKVYSAKVEGIVADISKLTLLEVADLNALLKKTLNISDAPVMAMGAAFAPPPKVTLILR